MTVGRQRRLGMVLALCAACNDPSPEEPFGQLCDEQGPVQLLATDDTERLLHVFSVREYGDRLLVNVFEHVDDVTEEWLLEPHPRSRMLSMDRCGGDAFRILDDVESAWPLLHDDVWFARRTDDTLLWVDPDGIREPVELGRGTGGSRWGDSVLLMMRLDERQAFELQQVWLHAPDDIERRTVLSAPLRLLSPGQESSGSDAVLGLTLERKLVEIDIDAGTTRAIADEVDEISRLHDAPLAILRTHAGPDSSYPADERMLDLRTMAIIELTPPDWPHSHTLPSAHTFSIYPGDPPDGEALTDLLFVPENRRRRMTGVWHAEARFADGQRVLIERGNTDDGLYLLDEPNAAPRLVYRGPSFSVRDLDSAGAVLSRAPERPHHELDCPTLLRVPFDGSPPSPVPNPACGDLLLPDGRFLALGSSHGNNTHSLHAIGPDGHHTKLADFVETPLRLYNEPWQFELQRDDFLYAIREPGGERNGLWRARLQPR